MNDFIFWLGQFISLEEVHTFYEFELTVWISAVGESTLNRAVEESTLYRGDLNHRSRGQEGYLPPFIPKLNYPTSTPIPRLAQLPPTTKTSRSPNNPQIRSTTYDAGLPSSSVSQLPSRVSSKGLPTVPCVGASQFFIQQCVLAKFQRER